MPPKFDDEEVKKKKPLPIFIEGVDILELTFPKLQELTLRLYEKLLNTREERISLQIERDKLRAFWEITRQEVDLNHATVAIKDLELQDAEAESYRLLTEIEQAVKYINYEHKQNISNLDKASNTMFAHVDEEMSEEEIQLLAEKKNLKEKYREVMFENQDELKAIREQNIENLSEVKILTECKLIEVEKSFYKYLNKMVDELILHNEMEMAQIEEGKNGHITDLKVIYRQQFQELKGYYNSITKEHLTVISNLKENIEKLKNKEAEMAKEVKIILQENESLKVPLSQTLTEVKELNRIFRNYEKDLRSLHETKKSIIKTTKNIDEIKLKNESICSIVKELRKTREPNGKPCSKLMEPSDMFDETTKSKISILEEMILQSNVELQSKIKILNNTILQNPEKGLEITKFLKNNCFTVEDLQYELYVVCKAHDDLIRSYEKKLEQFGIDKNKLCYKPLLLENIGLGPAGLVAKNL